MTALRFELPDPTPEQERFGRLIAEEVQRRSRQVMRVRQWALRQVFQECLVHCWETIRLVRCDDPRKK
jgi:hypothetical protein